MIRRILSFLMVLVIILSTVQVPVHATGETSTFGKVEITSASDITAGTYLIYGISSQVTDDGGSTAFMSAEEATKSRLMSSQLSITDGSVTTTDSYSIWNLIETSGGFYIQNAATETYLYYGDGSGNSIYQAEDTASAGVWTVVAHNDGWTLQEVASGRQLSCNRFGSEGSYYLGFAAYETDSSTARLLEFYKLGYSEDTEPESVIISGTCGENVTWVLDSDGTLTISGQGAMDDYTASTQPWKSYREQITAIVVESGVTSLGEGVFLSCSNAVSATISETVTSIPHGGGFAGCTSLQGIWVHEDNPSYSSDASGVLFNKDKTLLLRYPAGLAGDYTIPDTVTELGYGAFRGCDFMTGVVIPGSIQTIADVAFHSCDGLSDVTINEGVEAIGQEAFSSCDALAEIRLPSTITAIGLEVFSWDQALKEIWFTGDAPEFNDSVFPVVTATAYYPAGNPTWTTEVMQNYGGTITWTAYCSGEHTVVTDAAVAPTCTESGLGEGSHCSACGEIFTPQEEIPATGHTWDGGVVTKEPTEEDTGIRTYTCEVCDETRTETIPTLDHVHSYTETFTAPTCTEDGYTTYTCECGDSYVADYVDALGHTWDEGVVTKEATEDEKGEITYTCETCGETQIEEYEYEPSEPSEPVEPEIDVTRLYGNDRCETAIEVANMMKDTLEIETFDAIIIANGDNFADALAGSYLAAQKNAPILLYRASAVEMNLEYIQKNLSADGIVYLLGGTSAVPADVEAGLKEAGIEIKRLYGDTRFDTNLEILKEASIEAGQEILVATGYEFADSLSASATGLPILMVNTNKNELTKAQIEFLESLEGCTFTIIGGEKAVSKKLEADMEAIVGDVDRIYGNSREETSVLVAETYFEAPELVLLAYSRNFPDGLCGGPLAYVLGAPLILTNAGVEEAAAVYVAENGIVNGTVLGGTAALPDITVAIIIDQN